MKHDTNYTVSTATNVLALDAGDVAVFVRNCVQERSLSSVIAELNNAILFGDTEEERQARKALQHLGFI